MIIFLKSTPVPIVYFYIVPMSYRYYNTCLYYYIIIQFSQILFKKTDQFQYIQLLLKRLTE